MLDLLLPERCVVCRAGGVQLCDGCLARLPRLAPPLCDRCGARTEWRVTRCRECARRRLAFASARAAVEYDASVRTLLAAWKEGGLRRLGDTAAEVVADVVERPAADVLTFVPPDRGRKLDRGHHPAEALARGLALRWELPVRPLLARTRSTPRQRDLPIAQRRRNVTGAFEPRESPTPRRIVLVDDVYTTGATSNAAASALRRGGARRVDVVTFARAIRLG